MTKKVLLSTAQYAVYKGVNPQTVRRWISEGVITGACEKQGNAWKVDTDIADRLHAKWMSSVGPNQRGTIDSMQQRNRSSGHEGIADGPSLETGRDGKVPTIDQARIASEVYKAKLLQLSYDEKSGKLCSTAESDRAGYETGRMIRNALMSLVPRITPQVAAMTDHHEISRLLTDEFTEVLGVVSDDCERD